MDSCQYCRFWKKLSTDKKLTNYGECRRWAPRPVIASENSSWVEWPRTRNDEGCGECLPPLTTIRRVAAKTP